MSSSLWALLLPLLSGEVFQRCHRHFLLISEQFGYYYKNDLKKKKTWSDSSQRNWSLTDKGQLLSRTFVIKMRVWIRGGLKSRTSNDLIPRPYRNQIIVRRDSHIAMLLVQFSFCRQVYKICYFRTRNRFIFQCFCWMSLPCLSSVFSFFYCEFVPFVILSSGLHGDVNQINMGKQCVVLNFKEFNEFYFFSVMTSLTLPTLWESELQDNKECFARVSES